MSLFGKTGSGESLTDTPMSASGVTYAVVSVSLLLPVFVSLPVPLTPKFVDTLPSLTPRTAESARTTTMNVDVTPVGKLARVQVKVGAPLTAGNVQFQPAGTVADWNLSEPLLKELKLTLVAVLGPLFTTG